MQIICTECKTYALFQAEKKNGKKVISLAQIKSFLDHFLLLSHSFNQFQSLSYTLSIKKKKKDILLH